MLGIKTTISLRHKPNFLKCFYLVDRIAFRTGLGTMGEHIGHRDSLVREEILSIDKTIRISGVSEIISIIDSKRNHILFI